MGSAPRSGATNFPGVSHKVAKTVYESTLPPQSRDALMDFASACEGKGAAWRPEVGGLAVRLEWREAAASSVRNTPGVHRYGAHVHIFHAMKSTQEAVHT